MDDGKIAERFLSEEIQCWISWFMDTILRDTNLNLSD